MRKPGWLLCTLGSAVLLFGLTSKAPHPGFKILQMLAGRLASRVVGSADLFDIEKQERQLRRLQPPGRDSHHSSSSAFPSMTEAMNQARIAAAYGNLPLSFEANQGQSLPDVKFLSRGDGYTLFLTRTETVLDLSKSVARHTELRMKLFGANSVPRMTGFEELPGKSNYFIGNDPGKWRTNIPTYAKVRYESVYPGIDLVYYGKQRQLEYDFVVAPGSDPRTIRFTIDEEDIPHIDDQGDLVLGVDKSALRMRRPVVYQEISGVRKPVAGNFVIQSGQVGFEVAPYDASQSLVIDPVLSYSTFLGGGGTADEGLAIAVDSTGDAYVTGVADQSKFSGPTDFPKTAGAFQTTPGAGDCFYGCGDAFVTKLNAAGSALIYSTYLGGGSIDNAGGGETGYGIAVDSAGNAYVTGLTTSMDFPITTGAFQTKMAGYLYQCTPGHWVCMDAFVTKLNPSGSALVYSTYLGGSPTYYGGDHGSEVGYAIAVDSAGSAYVTGLTISTDMASPDDPGSTNFPTTPGALQTAIGGLTDVFVTKFSPDGSTLVYSTYLGGSGQDLAFGIAVDSSGSAYVTGYTYSYNFPTTTLAFQKKNASDVSPCIYSTCSDLFVTKFSPDGSTLAYSTYLGGSTGDDQGFGIAVDSSGSAYVTGYTYSSDFPVTANAFQKKNASGACTVFPICRDAFVTKLNAAGSGLTYSTYVGGAHEDLAYAIAVDLLGNAYIAGTTEGPFPQQNTFKDYQCCLANAFVTKLNAGGSALVYSTYHGVETDPRGIAVDRSGSAYVTGFTRAEEPFPFPTTANAFQTVPGSIGDAFVTKFPPVGLPQRRGQLISD